MQKCQLNNLTTFSFLTCVTTHRQRRFIPCSKKKKNMSKKSLSVSSSSPARQAHPFEPQRKTPEPRPRSQRYSRMHTTCAKLLGKLIFFFVAHTVCSSTIRPCVRACVRAPYAETRVRRLRQKILLLFLLLRLETKEKRRNGFSSLAYLPTHAKEQQQQQEKRRRKRIFLPLLSSSLPPSLPPLSRSGNPGKEDGGGRETPAIVLPFVRPSLPLSRSADQLGK